MKSNPMHFSNHSNGFLVDLAEHYVRKDQSIPADLYFLLIERGIDAAAIADGEPESTAGFAQHSQG